MTFDKYGREIEEFDLIKMFHFTGARRKRYYMYKWVVKRKGVLFCVHLDNNSHDSGFWLKNLDTKDIEIVQSGHWEKLEKKK